MAEDTATTDNPHDSALDPAAWLGALLRAFHPVRWLLCLIGVGVTAVSAVVGQAVFDGDAPRFAGWWEQPFEHAQALWSGIQAKSLGGAALRGLPLLALNLAMWGWIGGWIARHQLLARRRARYATEETRPQPSATVFAFGCSKSLLLCCQIVLIAAFVLLMPMLVAGLLNEWLGGVGALVVALFLPLLLLAIFLLLLIVLGGLAWPLMPVVIAAECSDSFDALSRMYSYVYQRPLRFLLLTAIALSLAVIPAGAILYSLWETMATWSPGSRTSILLLAAANALSIFWSLETLIYLHLRMAIDKVGAAEVAVEPLPDRKTKAPKRTAGSSAAGQQQENAAKTPASGEIVPVGLWTTVRHIIAGSVIGLATWCSTYLLFVWASGGQAEWLSWGFGETFVPCTEGAYKAASLIAAFWGVIWFGALLWIPIRRFLRGEPPKRRVEQDATAQAN